MRSSFLLVLAIFGAEACLTAPAMISIEKGADPGEGGITFPAASKALEIPGRGDGEWTLDRLLDEYGAATGQRFAYSRDTASLLGSSTTGLNMPLEVAPERVHSVVESIMIRNDFAFSIVHAKEPRLIGVNSLNTGARTQLRQSARFVKEDELAMWAEHPAYLITTAVHLPNVDVRTLSNSLRTMMVDANTQNIIPVGSSRSVILTGFGPNVAQLTEMLLAVNEVAELPGPEGGVTPKEREE